MSTELEKRNKVLRMAKKEQEEIKDNKTINIGKLTGKKFKSGQAPEIGVTWGPANKTNPIVFSAASRMKKKAEQIKLPENFSWSNPADIKKYHPALPSDVIAPILNQGDCGSCWAFATASTISDRWAIANKKSSPNLSPTNLLSCDTKDILKLGFTQAQCDGGNIAIACEYIAKNGITNSACQGYEWCTDDTRCYNPFSKGTGSAELNKLIPSCDGKCYRCTTTTTQGGKITRCTPVGDTEIPKIKIDSWPKTELNQQTQIFPEITATKTFTGAPKIVQYQIKEEIFKRGPVATVFKVFPEFYTDEKWYASPDGLVFIHDPSKHTTDKDNGWHAVSIVGWGRTKYKDGNKDFDLDYWVIRNSWGAERHNKGFFKFAFHTDDKDRGIQFNTMTGLDVPLEVDGVGSGGVTVPIIFGTETTEEKKTEQKKDKTDVSKQTDKKEEKKEDKKEEKKEDKKEVEKRDEKEEKEKEKEKGFKLFGLNGWFVIGVIILLVFIYKNKKKKMA